MRMTVDLPDGQLVVEFTPRAEQEAQEEAPAEEYPPGVDVKGPALLERAATSGTQLRAIPPHMEVQA